MLSKKFGIDPADVLENKGMNFFKVNKNLFKMNSDDKVRLRVETSYQICMSLNVFKKLKKIEL